MTRDQRRDARLMHQLGYTQNAIGLRLQLSRGQIQYALAHGDDPTRQPGRPSSLTLSQLEDLEAFVTASSYNRQLPYSRIPGVLGWNVGEYCIRHALRQLGYRRCVGRVKPPISEKNRLARLQWALEHRDWTFKQWAHILWTDETWVSPGKHAKVWVTRKPGEEYDPTCVVERLRRKSGWMFWGCFSGLAKKGPSLFWEKEWGNITGEAYRNRIVPLIAGWTQLHQTHELMQDNARAHAVAETIAELKSRGVTCMTWPAFSPDLNPIEDVWNWMKDWIQEHYPQETMTYDRLRVIVKEAWDAVPIEFLQERLQTMHDRCEAVIAANGLHTKY